MNFEYFHSLFGKSPGWNLALSLKVISNTHIPPKIHPGLPLSLNPGLYEKDILPCYEKTDF